MPGELPETATDHGGIPVGFWYGLVSLLAMLVGAFARNVLPTIPPLLTAVNTGKQQREEEARRLREEIRAQAQTEINRLQSHLNEERVDKERAEDERDHWKEEASRLRDEFVLFRAGCVGKGRPCNQEPPLIHLTPYTPPKPPDASHD